MKQHSGDLVSALSGNRDQTVNGGTQPETPLPWMLSLRSGEIQLFGGGEQQQSCVFGDTTHDPSVGIYGDPDGCKRDMEYIVHACNAYPKLVAELKRICVEVPRQLGSDLPWTNDLLRELGEL